MSAYEMIILPSTPSLASQAALLPIHTHGIRSQFHKHLYRTTNGLCIIDEWPFLSHKFNPYSVGMLVTQTASPITLHSTLLDEENPNESYTLGKILYITRCHVIVRSTNQRSLERAIIIPTTFLKRDLKTVVYIQIWRLFFSRGLQMEKFTPRIIRRPSSPTPQGTMRSNVTTSTDDTSMDERLVSTTITSSFLTISTSNHSTVVSM